MREIKYRVFVNNKFYYWGWINNQFVGLPVVSGLGQSEVIKTSQQFTGLHDKNGVPIFEGDIVERYYSATALDYVKLKPMVVVWENSGFILKGEDKNWEISENPEVIGNIYETPEILTNNQ